MTTKYGTQYVGVRACQNALHAIRYASDVGRSMNTHVTVNFTTLGVADDEAGPLFRKLQALVSRWWRDQRQRKGRDIGQVQGFHCHANPAGSRHVHWCLHVPAEIADEFSATIMNRLRKLTGRIDLGEGLNIGPVTTAGTLAKYILRGISPEYAEHFYIEPANEGLVRGCRRTGVSRAVSKSSRTRSGWVKKRARQA